MTKTKGRYSEVDILTELPRQVKDLTGHSLNSLVVIGYLGKTINNKHTLWLAKCECGDTTAVVGSRFQQGAYRTCGCVKRNHLTHGMTHTPSHWSWLAMRARCLDSTNTGYHNYGGRGITICDRWSNFQNFYEDMGERPEGKTLDRIDVNGNYEPGNCRWATPKEQCNNMRKNKNRNEYN